MMNNQNQSSSQEHKRYSRRRVLATGGAVLVAAGVALKPHDKSAPETAYFADLSKALRQAGVVTPTLIIDRGRLGQNIATLKKDLPSDLDYRIVTKSLPSYDLINEVAQKAGTDRMMVFNLPLLKYLSSQGKYQDVLLGKPLPVSAAANFYRTTPASTLEIQWLIDSLRRLAEYADLAKGLNKIFRISLEIDVGLHRGGFTDPRDIGAAIKAIQQNPHLSFAGFMGYEAHLASVPAMLGIRGRAKQNSWKIYQQALDVARDVLQSAYNPDHLVRNTGGSLTYKLYENDQIANEISAGSALVKPTHFDTDLLKDFQPATFIAAPVLKSSKGLNIPHMESLNSLMEFWDPNKRKTFFIYGGNWMADPVSPAGLSNNAIYGRSSNQEMLNGSTNIDLQPDDFIFFRPHQSEAVFLHFGDIAVYDNKAIVDSWPVFPATP